MASRTDDLAHQLAQANTRLARLEGRLPSNSVGQIQRIITDRAGSARDADADDYPGDGLYANYLIGLERELKEACDRKDTAHAAEVEREMTGVLDMLGDEHRPAVLARVEDMRNADEPEPSDGTIRYIGTGFLRVVDGIASQALGDKAYGTYRRRVSKMLSPHSPLPSYSHYWDFEPNEPPGQLGEKEADAQLADSNKEHAERLAAMSGHRGRNTSPDGAVVVRT
jgi:hypothetical protein